MGWEDTGRGAATHDSLRKSLLPQMVQTRPCALSCNGQCPSSRHGGPAACPPAGQQAPGRGSYCIKEEGREERRAGREASYVLAPASQKWISHLYSGSNSIHHSNSAASQKGQFLYTWVFCLCLTPLSLPPSPYHLTPVQASPLPPLLDATTVMVPSMRRPPSQHCSAVGPCLPSRPTTLAPNTTALATCTATAGSHRQTGRALGGGSGPSLAAQHQHPAHVTPTPLSAISVQLWLCKAERSPSLAHTPIHVTRDTYSPPSPVSPVARDVLQPQTLRLQLV